MNPNYLITALFAAAVIWGLAYCFGSRGYAHLMLRLRRDDDWRRLPPNPPADLAVRISPLFYLAGAARFALPEGQTANLVLAAAAAAWLAGLCLAGVSFRRPGRDRASSWTALSLYLLPLLGVLQSLSVRLSLQS